MIGHVQLRDLLICPKEPGVVNYVQREAIVEQNINAPHSVPRTVAELDFIPNSLTSLPVGTDDVLIAAGGQEADIHISYHTPSPTKRKTLWSINERLAGSINNSVLLTSLSLTSSNESSVEPRVGVSNNDFTIRFYDVPIRSQSLKRARKTGQVLKEVGSLKLDVPINHCDSNQVYLHSITGGARISFSHINTLSLPPPDYPPYALPPPSLAASFSTAFSADGMKFVVASQEGIVAIWDVRSSKPMKVFQTDRSRGLSTGMAGNGNASGWLSDDPWAWTRGRSRAPGWSVRNVKFGGAYGSEIMAFTEHTSQVHLVDARTFETHDIIQIPAACHKSRLTASTSVPNGTPPHRASRFLHPPSSVPYPLRRLPTNPRFSNALLSFLSPSSSDASPSAHSPVPGSPRLVVSSPPLPQSQGSSSNTPPRTPALVQALGDTFRIQSSYSPPASIGDSTWRTLHGVGARRPSDPTQTATSGVSGDRSQEAERERERLRVRGRDRDDRDREREEEMEADGYDEDDIVVIPPLGDRDVESEVHALLRMHGIASRQSSSSLRADAMREDDGDDEDRRSRYEDDDDDDDDDRNTGSAHADFEYRVRPRRHRRPRYSRRITPHGDESDCLSSRGPSRAPSPGPSSVPFSAYQIGWPLTPRESPSRAGTPRSTTSLRSSVAATTGHVSSRMDVDGDEDSDLEMNEVDEVEEEMRENEEIEDEGGRNCKDDIEIIYEDDLDLAGICFDSTGGRMYVASTKSVAEWKVRGAEKGWWAGGSWA
ncbi:hypothetical protein CC1G_07852 [Coprinopsis cinerea okayama7|uniref:DUF2415 domain-containing protein n=1 Tax=Coprinopsis cinerea (strain Okayama-7 / 130 / ATCC MYA-4618 / FGSC 9003) TaxID=240176 RepID=A8P423_COPC7|nr:hypothetical protein CC1G_07852 [Coprinopsis cinerea okayama7\|eukprot:XP_001838661.2 hypothetical protein CC1G_07852 [Coprinopsis cinerea okayama7\